MNENRSYYSRITMALDDLLRCRRYCEVMLKLPLGEAFSEERTIYESLYVAFIVSYGRVFTTSNTVNKLFMEGVNSKFGKFRVKIINEQEEHLQKLHKEIFDKRDTSIAHSDASSRNYQYYKNSPMPVGRNPYVPYGHAEVSRALILINNLISSVGSEQVRVAKFTFDNNLFGAISN